MTIKNTSQYLHLNIFGQNSRSFIHWISVLQTSPDALTWTHHQCCFLESQGVSGLTTDTLVQATPPGLIRPRPVSKWHSTPPTSHPSSARAIWMFSPQPLRCFWWLSFDWHLFHLVCHRTCSGHGWQIPDSPPLVHSGPPPIPSTVLHQLLILLPLSLMCLLHPIIPRKC